jgi:biotin transport system substrate-specific component
MPANTLITRLFPALAKASVLKKFMLVLVGTLALTLSAKIQVPLYPVKISMQSFTVILLACLYGRSLGVATLALYLFEGALGLPVFQGTPDRGIGLAYMVGPTGGYLVGFLISSYVVGALFEKGIGSTVLSSLLLFICGSAIIDAFGLSWLTYLMGFSAAKSTYLSYQFAFFLKAGLFVVIFPFINYTYKKLLKK